MIMTERRRGARNGGEGDGRGSIEEGNKMQERVEASMRTDAVRYK